MTKAKQSGIEVLVREGDALTTKADVLALKYAQSLFGVDLAVADRLFPGTSAAERHHRLPKISEHCLEATQGKIAASQVLYVGVKLLHDFGYQEIREFGRRIMEILTTEAPDTEHLALTLHGANYGLDEREAFESEVAGLLDAVQSGEYPPAIRRITFVERSSARAQRLSHALLELLPNRRIVLGGNDPMRDIADAPRERLRSVGYASASKPFIFVAMPFASEFDDAFHYGISGAANASGFLCERADLSSFVGDVMDWVKKRISGATMVVADLSTANANVYLEVGYAWGCGKPTVLLVRDSSELKFDVKGQRCLVYNKSIKSLEALLKVELQSLRASLAL